MTKKVQTAPITHPNGVGSWEAAFAGSSPDHAMSFELKDMADMTIPEFSLPEASRQTNGKFVDTLIYLTKSVLGAASAFQTDSDISGSAIRGERILQRWVPDATGTTDFSLEGTSTTGWDQFATHEKMTGGQSTYTEETYTTTIDRNAPDYKRREAEAARIAREIESQTSTNAHVREERGQALENDFGDEEDKYSGVRREQRDYLPLATGGANRYTPPALRAPSAQATTAGAPVDSAIISAQLARPDAVRSGLSNQSAQDKAEPLTSDKVPTLDRAVSAVQNQSAEPGPLDNAAGISTLAVNGSASKTIGPKQMPSVSPQHQADTETPSQGVENKVLDQFRQFANSERARLAERKRVQASQDRTAKINDLVRFSKTFKLKTPVPNDLVGILAKDPKKQEQIMEKAQRDHEEAKTAPPTSHSASSSGQLPSVPKFDKSQIPERNTLNNSRGTSAKQSLTRGQRAFGQPSPFTGGTVPLAPRGQVASLRDKNVSIPAPIPMPEIRSGASAAADKSGLSSPRGTDTPTSAVSTKFNVRALEFRPTVAPFNPTAPSVSAASPSPVARTASIARSANPSLFFGSRKPKPASERIDVMQHFNPIDRMKREVQNKLLEKSEEPVRDFAANGGVPNAYHTQPTWIVSDANKEKTYEDFFVRAAPPAASPVQSRSSSSQAIPFHGQMQQMASGPHMSQASTPQHSHHGGNHYQPHFEDQRLHMQNGSPQVFASPNMTPRNMYATPMGHPAPAYAHQSYFGAGGPVPMRPYGNNPVMMHSQHGQMSAPMMVQQQSSGPFMGVPGQYQGMMYPSPNPSHVYPQQNGFPSPGRMAPVMMHQNSQQAHLGHQQMMYSATGHNGAMYGQQHTIGRGYGGNHTPYGTSPHQPLHLNQRAMSSSYTQKGMPQMTANSGPPANAPQQPAAFGQMPISDDGK